MSATAESWPPDGLEPSRLGKLRVEWRMDSAPLAGVSPAPKQGPQKAFLSTAPAAISLAVEPLRTRARACGSLAGYTERLKAWLPVLLPSRMAAVRLMFSKEPPAQPAMMPWSTQTPPSRILPRRFRLLPAPPNCRSASASTAARISSAWRTTSATGKTLLGWKGRAIMGSILPRSTRIRPS